MANKPETAAPPARPLPDHDNHHNALRCPYCNPDGLVLAPMGLEAAARDLLAFIRERFPDDFKPGGKGFTCPHHLAIQRALEAAPPARPETAALVEALRAVRWIREFAEAHHADEAGGVHLHHLTIDIPHYLDYVIALLEPESSVEALTAAPAPQREQE